MSFLFGSSAEGDKKVAIQALASPATGATSVFVERKTTSAEDPEVKLVQDSSVVVPVSAAIKRLMGKKTASMKMKGTKGDGVVFALQSIPSRLFKPAGGSNVVVKVPQEVLSMAFLTSSVTVPVFASISFTVNSLDQISHLTALWDQYRITLIEAWLVPNNNTAIVGGNVASVIDYDDANNLTTYAQALDYVNVVSANGDLAHYRCFKPHCAVAAYSGSFTSFLNVESPWIDAASPSVQHYGLKFATPTTTAAIVYDLTYRLHTEWRNIR